MSKAKKADVLGRIHEDGIIPILRTPTAEDALELAEVLRSAGIHSLEIPLTVPRAIDVIQELSVSFSPDLVIGAGTVITMEDAMAVHEAGASFIVMPVFDHSIIAYCRTNGLGCFPGALTPTEILTAWGAGADAVKVFPASAMGGPDYIKAIKAPLPQITLMPTGGVTVQNASKFIEAGAWALGVGGDLTDVQAIRSGKSNLIRERAELYLELVKEARQQRNLTPPPPPAR
jgi:2-dehydro-3-deoxyphosphogluconate aldolase / (4S)-4-hydroxy-2-oxoglutarate aldolase